MKHVQTFESFLNEALSSKSDIITNFIGGPHAVRPRQVLAVSEAASVPSNIMDFAKRKGPYAVSLVKKAAKWAEAAGKKIVGGTAIGKNYDTLVLDMKYQGSEIYINLDKEKIMLFDEEVTDAKSFAKVLQDSESEE